MPVRSSKPRPKPSRMLWFGFRDAGNYKWKVYLVDRCTDEQGDFTTDLGTTEFERRRIEVTIRQTAREIRLAALHEIMHACGGKRRRAGNAMEIEEGYISRAEYSLASVFRQLGAKLPDFPKGFRPQQKRAA